MERIDPSPELRLEAGPGWLVDDTDALWELRRHYADNGPLAGDYLDGDLARLRHLACEKFGHEAFTRDTVDRLCDWLCVEHNLEPRAALLLPRARVCELLSGEGSIAYVGPKSAKDWATTFDKHCTTFKRWIEQGRFRYRKEGSQYWLHPEDAEKYATE